MSSTYHQERLAFHVGEGEVEVTRIAILGIAVELYMLDS
jgi:hypothetical protein